MVLKVNCDTVRLEVFAKHLIREHLRKSPDIWNLYAFSFIYKIYKNIKKKKLTNRRIYALRYIDILDRKYSTGIVVEN